MAFVTSRATTSKYRAVHGLILRLPSGIICVPTEYQGEGIWAAVVVGGGVAPYTPGCWDIAVYPDQIDGAERIEVA